MALHLAATLWISLYLIEIHATAITSCFKVESDYFLENEELEAKARKEYGELKCWMDD